MNLLQQMLTDWPIVAWRDCHLVVAVSGGADSVAMLRLLHAAHQDTHGRGKLHVAHFNHQLRDDESDKDQQWVAQLAENLKLDFHTAAANQFPSPTMPPSKVADAASPLIPADEASLRNLRYQFLLTTAEQIGARYIAVAHSADDQVETILHRFIRGTGIKGLGGMPRSRPLSEAVTLVRPLLHVTRTDLRNYLSTLPQSFREDASNASAEYTRNRIRHELIPAIEAIAGPSGLEAIGRLGSQAEAVSQWMRQYVDEKISECGGITEESVDGQLQLRVPTSTLACLPDVVRCEVGRTLWRHANWPQQTMGHQHWTMLSELIASEATSRRTLPSEVVAWNDAGMLHLQGPNRARE